MARVAVRYCGFCVSGLHAVRVAARMERTLGIEVDRVKAGYGEYKVLVDGEVVVDGGMWVVVGVMPPVRLIMEKVRERLGL